MDKQKFLEMVKELVNDQYSDNSSIDEFGIELQYLDRVNKIDKIKKCIDNNYYKPYDLTNCKNQKDLKKIIPQYSNFKVGCFYIKKMTTSKNNLIDLCIFESKPGTIMKTGCSDTGNGTIEIKVDILKDSRFNKCVWSKYFNNMKNGIKIPQEIISDIVRWLQAVQTISAFL